MSAELIPIKAGQHSVILVPRATTDLPFFYLTKQKAALSQNIDYRGVDTQGKPIRWQAFPSNNPAIGAPGIEAHEVWMRLVKPTIDEKLNIPGIPQDVIPLGKVRECLRIIGWQEGGWRATQFLKALRQIGATWCVADLWIPTTQTDKEGNIVFQHINAEFSKMTIYSIGQKHLTEEQLKDSQFNFDFDLEDTVYIQLHPIEVQLQRNQPQRLIDNQYLFSVKPTSRRWYELVAAKIFGVVKNKGTYCEIKYSWYVKHHHTLKRHFEQKRVVDQMNEIIKDHLAAGYINKVEYRKFKEPDQELDWIIRYYPGEAAKESIGRILKFQYNKRISRGKERVSVKAAPTPAEKAIQSTEQGSAATNEAFQPILFEMSLTTEEHNLASRLIIEFGITAAKAQELVRTHLEQTRLQLEAYSHRKTPADKAGWIIRAIENSYALPQAFQKVREKRQSELAAQARRDAIDACQLCNVSGYRLLKKTDQRTGQTIEAFRKCTHDPETEAAYQ